MGRVGQERQQQHDAGYQHFHARPGGHRDQRHPQEDVADPVGAFVESPGLEAFAPEGVDDAQAVERGPGPLHQRFAGLQALLAQHLDPPGDEPDKRRQHRHAEQGQKRQPPGQQQQEGDEHRQGAEAGDHREQRIERVGCPPGFVVENVEQPAGALALGFRQRPADDLGEDRDPQGVAQPAIDDAEHDHVGIADHGLEKYGGKDCAEDEQKCASECHGRLPQSGYLGETTQQ